MGEPLPILVRDVEPGDLNFVRATWLRSGADSDLARALGRAYWDRTVGHHAVIDALLRRARVRVACSVTHHPTIVGWACVEPPGVAHYVFVREEFRRFGVARQLLDVPPVDHAITRLTYTHRTHVCKVLPIPPAWTFNPYRAFIQKEAA